MTTMKHKPAKSALAAAARWGCQPLILHKWDHVDQHGRQRGKSPLANDWRRVKYKPPEVFDAYERGHNIGLRLPAEVVVLDWDPRNSEGQELARGCPMGLRLRCRGLPPDRHRLGRSPRLHGQGPG